jgi:hypothetical protein
MRNKFRERIYTDSYATDGVIANGWRTIRKGGKIKVDNTWWYAKELEDLVGELVYFSVYDYWMEKLQVQRGRIGCMSYYCDAKPAAEKENNVSTNGME